MACSENSPGAKLAIVELVQRDMNSARQEYLFKPPKIIDTIFMQLIEDPRDAPLLYVLFNQLVLVVPAACILFKLPASHAWGVMYFVCNYALFLQRFMLMLHFTEHRRLFRKGVGALNWIIPYLLCPLYGLPFGLYRLHHVIMHHTEDNQAPLDASSTEPYQRDNLLHFIQYWTTFWLAAWVQLPYYAYRRQRIGSMLKTLASMGVYLAIIGHLWQRNFAAALWGLVVPFFVSSLALMFGNWSQHIFVDPHQPRNPYRHTYNTVATEENQRTFNDGYHILHHANSRTHWSLLPAQMLATLPQHDDNQALAFQGIGVFDVGLAVFTGRLGWLADHLVPCGPKEAAWSRDDIIAVLKHRLKPVTGRVVGK